MSFRRIVSALAAAASLSILSAVTSHAGCVVLAWTAPGEDSLSGTAARYDLRYSTQPITSQNFAQATPVTEVFSPDRPGVTQSFGIENLQTGATYYFAIRTQDSAGNWSVLSNVVSKKAEATAGVIPGLSLSFSEPRPNPCRETATFSFSLPSAGEVDIEVFDVTGRHVRTMATGRRPAGSGSFGFDLRDDSGTPIAAGVYLVRARIGEAAFTRRVVVTR